MAKITRYFIFILPIFFFWAGTKMTKVKYANDPEYIYLVNAAAICDGKFVGHIDNPGTTVMQIGAVTIALKHLFSNPEDQTIIEHIFSEPNQFVNAIRFVILILNTLALFFMGWFAIKKTGSVWLAIFLQSSMFITANTLDHVWTKMSPEPLLFFVTALYVIAILFYYAEKEKNSWKYVIIFSLITGAGLATKATFLPLIVFPLVVIPTFNKKTFYLLGIIPAFVLFTIPAIPEYERMYFWFRRLLAHSGKYGQGEQQIIDTQTYLPNILKIFENNPVFGITIAVGILTLIITFFSKKKTTVNLKFLAGLLASVIFGVLLIAKQYNGNHYLIPILLLTGITFYFIIKTIFNKNKISKPITMAVFTLFLTAFLIWQQPSKLKYANYGYKITNAEMDSTNIILERDFSDYTIIYYYPYSLNKYSALNFGDVYTNRKMLGHLKKMYPDTYFYDFGINLMQYWNAEINLEDVVEFNGYNILLVGGPRNEKLLPELEKRGLPFKKVYNGRIQAISELDTIKFKQIIPQKTIIEKVIGDLENTTSDNQNFIDAFGNSFGPTWSRTNEKSRSGNYAVKMDEKTEFALEFVIDSLNPRDNYEIEVWRNADNYSARLVVGAVKPDIFYKAQNDFITSENGWDLIRIKFTVTENMANETVKVYLWNKDKKMCYFDDLTIKKVKYIQNNTETAAP